jgi:pyruvate dehydrogenase E2 component (dihydrolipoamide acetyltransferase)
VATRVEMPKLGNTVEECLLTSWLKHKGDTVRAGDVLAEVETDKASFEVTAPADGVVLDTFYDEGALVPVYAGICIIGAAGEAVALPEAPARPAPATTPEPNAAPAAAGQAAGPTAGARPGRAPLSPRARRFAREHRLASPVTTGTGPGGRVTEADLREAYYSKPRVSGAAARALAEGYLPPSAGSGAGGMIRAADLRAPAERLSPVRQRIADRVRHSLASTAQYTLNGSANAAGLLAARAMLKASPLTAQITINDLVTYCTIRALQRAPELNAELVDGELRRHADVHLAFACDTDRGLLVPVVRASQRLTLQELSARMRDLADQAARGTISPDDLAGGTFTVTNLGSLGVESFTPVLNPPQVAVLGVDTITVRPARKADGNIEFVDAIGLSLTLDHQVIDGAPGARFLALLRREIENAEALCTT